MKKHHTLRLIGLLALGFILSPNLKAAFIVEPHASGRAFANFSVAGGTATQSTTKGTALGLTQTHSAFGSGTYTFNYTPGTDSDNFTPTTGINLGNGNLATGAAGGISGNYNVYVTWPNSANINPAGTKIEVFNDSTTVEWPVVDQNNTAPANVDYPGVNKWWCVATNVPLTAGTAYTVVSTPNAATFVGQRFSGVMWERTPEVVDPCTATPLISLTNAPYVVGTNVTVPGVSGTATKITIYQNTGSGMTEIGSKTTGIVDGVNIVTTTTPLAKEAILAATQTVGGQEGCVPSTGPFVGSGANPSVRIALSIRETTDTGPVGATATVNSSTFIHFLGASTNVAASPTDAAIYLPTNVWQTVTIGGKAKIANSSNAVGTAITGTTYSLDSSVFIQVFPFKTVNGTRLYSEAAGAAQSASVTSNNTFAVNWTWATVATAEGYRVLRNVNNNGFLDSIDVTTNSLIDTNSAAWVADVDTTQTSVLLSSAIQWNGQGVGVINTNGPATAWGILESIAFAINDEDTGSFDLYIDNIQNGETVFQTFETVPSGTQDYGFRAPGFSGTTDDHLLSFPNLVSPNVGIVTNIVADTGTNSFNVKFQWNNTNQSAWLRLTTSTPAGGANNPLVNLDDPTSFRLLLLPVGASLPSGAPTITYSLNGNQLVLNWIGSFNLESKTNLNEAAWTSVGVSTGPYTNTVTGTAKFYRLHNP